MTDFLQYGALGLLALVLVAVGTYVKSMDRASRKFLEDLFAKLTEQQEKQAAAWREMMQMAVAAQEKNCASVEKVCGLMDKHDERTTKEHSSFLALAEARVPKENVPT